MESIRFFFFAAQVVSSPDDLGGKIEPIEPKFRRQMPCFLQPGVLGKKPFADRYKCGEMGPL